MNNKNIKKINLFSALLLLTATFNPHKTHTMKRSDDIKKTHSDEKLTNAVSSILSDEASAELLLTDSAFNELPLELKHHIVSLLSTHSNAKSLEEAAFTIYSLSWVNKELNTLINDPIFCLKIIKTLAQRYKVSHEEVAKVLQTTTAKKYYALQEELYQLMLLAHIMPFDAEELSQFNKLCEQGLDLDFTYAELDEITTKKEDSCLGITPLMFAAQTNNIDIMKLLIAKGANINAINLCGRTALMIAANAGHTEAVKLLIAEPNININQEEFEFGETALSLACFQNNQNEPEINNAKKEIVKILLAAGADPELGNAPHIALTNEAHETYKLLQDAIEENKRNNNEKK